jgi:hypothetical protein
VDPKGDRTHLEEKRLLLENRLNEITEQADHYFDPLTPSLSPRETVLQYEKTDYSEKGQRQSGGKDLER